MSKKHKKNLNAASDIAAVKAAGYTVHQFSDIHFRISAPHTKLVVDVWPTTRKLWVFGSKDKSHRYSDILEELRNALVPVSYAGTRQRASGYQEWREGLDRLQQILKSS